ncbi:TPA: FHA domain-containing protein [Acinetobacter nosocomialis]|uniref:FHA domain-containing protein n=1 Tax=Acinetobacter nosocomialis TaxID=106654 RepID=A0A1V0YWX6_ACINO|nr:MULTISPECIES: FHA domain-containing protein [Acinetobacter calcoaceticus/baumannii complex]ARG18525.1 FHA domain-containing protein [Acinetobacter nosocomialis]AVF45770.1 FHA domain-containing protein [Acinetobacter nosocomialis]AZC10588.1 FHA domain-containing protein [Acinetobacter nosocomialis]EKU6034733.1 FHA domain-containing protein [Acinetobacter nosocomialis]EXE78739.1 FHA domain protein [Acinetobacter sp. 1566109]
MTWKLQAITGEFTGQEISIDRDMLVGRHQDADLLLQAAEISRRHAALLLKDQLLWVQDLNSSNGTFVNDIRIEQEKQLHDGDIVQFASFKFSVLAPAQENNDLPEIEAEPVQAAPAQDLSDQGMPSLAERAAEVEVRHDGMPQNISIPKPAPIPEGVNIHAQPEQTPVAIEEPVSRVAEEKEQQKNASIGLITIIILVILAVLAWLFFK